MKVMDNKHGNSSHSNQNKSNSNSDLIRSPAIGFHKERMETTRRDDLRRIKVFESFIGKVLEQMYYINKLRDEHKNVAEVENIKEKIDKATRKLQEYANQPEQTEEQTLESSSGPSGDNIPIEKHPLLPDLGGMPLSIDNMDPAFFNDLIGTTPITDKAELQNQLKNKLQAKRELLNKLTAKFKHENKPKLQMKAEALAVKYEMTIKNLPKMLPPQPEPEYKPRYMPTPPKPTMGG